MKEITTEIRESDVDVELVENPRADGETLVEEFDIDTTKAHECPGWGPNMSIASSIGKRV